MKHPTLFLFALLLALIGGLGASCCAPHTTNSRTPPGAFHSGKYQNLFAELLGKSDDEIQAKLDAAWDHLFYGDGNTQRVYYPVGTDMAYIEDIGNGDVRTEGMSYGMMIAVQMDKQEEFDRLWKWAKTYMYHEDGPYQGYFAWHCTPEGEPLDANPASDGEEWFAMALFFAAGRWGNGEGIYNHEAEAQAILHTMLHKTDESDDIATNMFHPEHKQVVFVPRLGGVSQFTDPSYHLPHYYELWARWADKDNEFWAEAAIASRGFLKQAAHPETGLMPDYANFDGSPIDFGGGGHDACRFDSWRNSMNVAMDYAWFAADKWEVEQSNRLLEFYHSQGANSYGNQHSLDGECLCGDHSLGLVAMNASAGLAATTDKTPEFVQALWDASPPCGKWRYYDGLLYMLGLLNASGSFRIYSPAE